MKEQKPNLSLVLLAGSLVLVAAILPAQIITTVAGTGATTFFGDGGLAVAAALNHPRGIAVDASGNIFVADLDNSRVRMISPTGTITTVAGTGFAGFSGDGGAATGAMLNQPQAVAIDASGNLIIGDTQNRRIRKVNSSGTITTIAGSGIEGDSGDGGPATSATFHTVTDLAVDSFGNIYFSDGSSHRVRRIGTNGIIATVAGTGTAGFSGDGGAATFAQLNFPVSIAIDAGNNIFIADGNNFRIRKASSGGIMSTVAGNGTGGFSGDGGAAFNASLNFPYGVRADATGRFFIADAANNRVRVVNAGGIISTLAGTGVDGFAGDGGAATSAMLSFPWALGLDRSGNVLIGDRANSRVREVVMNAVTPTPTLFANGVVNGASFASAGSANGAISPGAIVSIFGSDMASGSLYAPGVPLPTALSDTSVTMNGTPVPLFFASSGQINAQVPFGITSSSVSVQVKRGTQVSGTQTARFATASPGVFTLNAQGTGDGAFLHAATFQLVGAGSPAQAGEFILIFATGLGVTTPAVAAGTAAPSSPLSTTLANPTVTIGGQAAVVAFSGLAPGFVGLYQINAQIPAGLPSGSQQVQVFLNGVSANVTTVVTR